MGFSALAALALPARLVWLEGLVFEPVWWVSGSVTDSTAALRDALAPSLQPRAPAGDARRLRAENEQLRRQVAQLSRLLEQREQELRELAGLREILGDLPVRLLPAYVLAGDASPTRRSLVIARGSSGPFPLHVGDWVAAAPAASGPSDQDGRQRLLAQWLVGRVAEVGPLTSRVRLTTDPAFGPVPVRAARVDESGRCIPLGPVVLLHGSGGSMRVREAPLNFLERGAEWILTEPIGRIPLAMLVGRITSARPVPQSALHYDLVVEPLSDPHRLRRVYVIWLPGGETAKRP